MKTTATNSMDDLYKAVIRFLSETYNCHVRVEHITPVRNNVNAYLTYSNKSFIISINKHIEYKTQLLAFAHEVIHIFQVLRGDLELRPLDVIYQGVSTSRKDIVKMDYSTFANLPWEKEAYALQESLAIAIAMGDDLTRFIDAKTERKIRQPIYDSNGCYAMGQC